MGDGSSGSSLLPSWGPGLNAEFPVVAWSSSGHCGLMKSGSSLSIGLWLSVSQIIKKISLISTFLIIFHL